MMTVRFPTGFSVQYSTARFADRSTNYTDLYTKRGGAWVAQVPNDAVIEGVLACRTYSASGPSEDVAVEIRELRKKVMSLSRLVRKLGGAQ
jgi:hypothetical protein